MSGFIIKVHVREQGGQIIIIINLDQLVDVVLVDVLEDVEADLLDAEELDLDGANIQAPAPVLTKVAEIGEEDLLVLWGHHNQPGAFDAARLLLVGQECLWVTGSVVHFTGNTWYFTTK